MEKSFKYEGRLMVPDKLCIDEYTMEEYLLTHFNGNDYSLPLVEIAEGVKIAVFDCYSDVSMLTDAAMTLCQKLQDSYGRDLPADVVMTSETKGIPFAIEVARMYNIPFILCRKTHKPYIKDVYQASTNTYTTEGSSTLYADASFEIKGKKVLLVDDVVSTGASFNAMENIVEQYGATVSIKAAVFAEGKAADREDVLFVRSLPIVSN